MSNTKSGNAEKRKHQRFKAKKGAFARINSKDKKAGQIKNISKGGLSFQYIDDGEPLSGSIGLELFSITNDFYLKKLSANVVRDSEVAGVVPVSSAPMRELAVQFGVMESNQRNILNCFIRQYTTQR
jgi:hypothetical protein